MLCICMSPGMQHSVIQISQPYGLGLNETLLPQYLQKLGYATHAVGKVSGVLVQNFCAIMFGKVQETWAVI